MTEVWLAVAAGVGAPTRYVTEAAGLRAFGPRWPWGTLAVNVLGAFALGLLTGWGLHHGLSHSTRAIFGTGFCGAFTTYSGFALETVWLGEQGRRVHAGAYVVLTLGAGLGAAGAGLGIALL